jgi:hypothetical protein
MLKSIPWNSDSIWVEREGGGLERERERVRERGSKGVRRGLRWMCIPWLSPKSALLE